MQTIAVAELQPGQVMAQSLLDEKGQVLLHRGVQLTDQYIKALRDKGFQYLYVRDDDEEDLGIEPEEDLTPMVRARAVMAMQRAFKQVGDQLQHLRELSLEDAKKALESDEVRALVAAGGPLDKLQEIIGGILDDVLVNDTIAGLASMRSEDTQLYQHALDVCVVSLLIGKATGLPNARMKPLAMGCLLHDIGKLFISPRLDRRSAIIQHTTLGFELLRKSENSEMLAPFVAYEHHEHQDGTGLPRGIIGSNRIERNRNVDTPIPTLIGEIAAVANAYDNLLTGAGNGQPLSPDQVIAKITEGAGTLYNKEIILAFRRVTPVYPRATQVILSGGPYNGYVGVVSEVRPTQLNRPKVILVRNAKRERIEPLEIDTLNHEEIGLRTAGA